MGNFGEYCGKLASELSVLSGDIQRMVSSKNKDSKDVSLRSLQPTIKMYASKEDAVKSKENKEADFIRTQLNKIFGG